MIGQIVDHYRITARLGAGAMGVVWKAFDTQLERDVALKLIAPADTGDSQSIARFLREARCASALNSPNIVTIYQASSFGDVHFIAMEYVPGETLKTTLRAGRLPLLKTADIAGQIAQALVHAHAAGIVHRDLKPANIIVTPAGLVKVLDFGLAKRPIVPPVDEATVTEITAAGTAVGTLPYMSPEQIAGDNVDARSDIFSFGVVLYEMLTGDRPFRADTRLDLVKRILQTDPVPPRTLAPGTPPGLESVVVQCLRKAPADRFQTAGEIVTRIRAAVEPFQSKARRFPLRWAYAAVVLAIIAAGLSVPTIRRAFVSNGTAPAAPIIANEVDAYRAGRAYLDHDKPGNLDRAIEMMQASLQKNSKYAPAYAGLSEAYLRRNVASPDAKWLALARDAAQKSVSLNPDLALSHVAFGRTLFEAGKRAEAAAEFERARDLDPKNPAPAVGLAKIAAAAGNRDEAGALFKKGMDLGPSEVTPFTEYGTFLFRNERYDDAIKAFEHARELTPDSPSILDNEGAAYHMAGRYEEAASLFQQALTIEPSARVYANLGTLRFFQGRYSDAVGPMEKAVEMRATYYMYWGNLGDVYRWAPGLRGKANGAYARAIDLIREKIAAAPDDPVLRARLAGYLAKSGQTAAALSELERFERVSKKSGMALFKAAIAYEVAGQRDAALQSLDAARRAGYSTKEIEAEAELSGLRADVRYQRALAAK